MAKATKESTGDQGDQTVHQAHVHRAGAGHLAE